MTQAAKFWDRHAVKYAKSTIKDMAAYEYTLERTRSYLTGQTKALELGCGTGSTALLLAPDVDQLVGSDVSPEMVRIATEKARSKNAGNVTFKVADADEAIQGIGNFDVVMGFNVFHLTENAERLFGDIYDQLKVGGVFISKTPCLAEPSIGIKRFAFAAMIPVMQILRVAPFVRRFRFTELEAAITQAGFEIVETGSFPAMSRFIVARRRA